MHSKAVATRPQGAVSYVAIESYRCYLRDLMAILRHLHSLHGMYQTRLGSTSRLSIERVKILGWRK